MNAPGAKQTEWKKSAKKLIFMHSECVECYGIVDICDVLKMQSLLACVSRRFTSTTYIFVMLIRELIHLFIHQIYIAWVQYTNEKILIGNRSVRRYPGTHVKKIVSKSTFWYLFELQSNRFGNFDREFGHRLIVIVRESCSSWSLLSSQIAAVWLCLWNSISGTFGRWLSWSIQLLVSRSFALFQLKPRYEWRGKQLL